MTSLPFNSSIKKNIHTPFLLILASLLFIGCFGKDDKGNSNPMQTETEPKSSVVEIAQSNPEFSTLVQAISAAGLAETLAEEGPFTVFAPTNSAFEALPAGTVESLLEDPEGALTQILLYHVVSGKVSSDQVVNLTEAPTINGEKINIKVENGAVILNDNIRVTSVDIEASNGTIHVIDAVLIP